MLQERPIGRCASCVHGEWHIGTHQSRRAPSGRPGAARIRTTLHAALRDGCVSRGSITCAHDLFEHKSSDITFYASKKFQPRTSDDRAITLSVYSADELSDVKHKSWDIASCVATGVCSCSAFLPATTKTSIMVIASEFVTSQIT